jgi:hypothetical protein
MHLLPRVRFQEAPFCLRELWRRACSPADPSGSETREESTVKSKSRQIEAMCPAQLKTSVIDNGSDRLVDVPLGDRHLTPEAKGAAGHL